MGKSVPEPGVQGQPGLPLHGAGAGLERPAGGQRGRKVTPPPGESGLRFGLCLWLRRVGQPCPFSPSVLARAPVMGSPPLSMRGLKGTDGTGFLGGREAWRPRVEAGPPFRREGVNTDAVRPWKLPSHQKPLRLLWAHFPLLSQSQLPPVVTCHRKPSRGCPSLVFLGGGLAGSLLHCPA